MRSHWKSVCVLGLFYLSLFVSLVLHNQLPQDAHVQINAQSDLSIPQSVRSYKEQWLHDFFLTNQTWSSWGFVVPHVSLTEDRSRQPSYEGDLLNCETQMMTSSTCYPEDILKLLNSEKGLPIVKLGWDLRPLMQGTCFRALKQKRLSTFGRWHTESERKVDWKKELSNGSLFVGMYNPKRLYMDPPMGMLMIPESYVTVNGIVLDCNRQIGAELVCSNRFTTDSRYLLTEKLGVSPPAAVTFREETYRRLVVIDQTHAEQYFHFMIETLPKVALIPNELLNDPNTHFFVQSDQPFVRNMLRSVMPLQAYERVVYGTKGQLVRGQMVYYLQPSICHMQKLYNINRIRMLIYEKFNLSTVRSNKRQNWIIFIDRGADADRSIANQNELLSILRTRYPGEVVKIFSSDSSFEDTVGIFHRAKVIIGSHGAGLSNMIFSLAGTPVLEFMISKQLLCYHDLAAALGMYYATFQPSDAHWKSKNIHVKPEQFIAAVDQMLAYANSKDIFEFPWRSTIRS